MIDRDPTDNSEVLLRQARRVETVDGSTRRHQLCRLGQPDLDRGSRRRRRRTAAAGRGPGSTERRSRRRSRGSSPSSPSALASAPNEDTPTAIGDAQVISSTRSRPPRAGSRSAARRRSAHRSTPAERRPQTHPGPGNCPQAASASLRVDRLSSHRSTYGPRRDPGRGEQTWCWARPASGVTGRGSPVLAVCPRPERAAAPHQAGPVPAGPPTGLGRRRRTTGWSGRPRRAQGGGPACADPPARRSARTRGPGAAGHARGRDRDGVARPGAVAPGRRTRAGS